MQRDVVNASELRPLFLAERNTRDLTDMVDEYGDFPLRDYGAQLMLEVSNIMNCTAVPLLSGGMLNNKNNPTLKRGKEGIQINMHTYICTHMHMYTFILLHAYVHMHTCSCMRAHTY